MNKMKLYAVMYKTGAPSLCLSYQEAEMMMNEHLENEVENLDDDICHLEWLIDRREREIDLRYGIIEFSDGRGEHQQRNKIQKLENEKAQFREELDSLIVDFYKLLDNPKAECSVVTLYQK